MRESSGHDGVGTISRCVPHLDMRWVVFHRKDDMGGGHAPYHGPKRRVFTIGVGGPVGSRPGTAAQFERLCRNALAAYQPGGGHQRHLHEGRRRVSRPQTGDPAGAIVEVETGGCPAHSAIRESASINLAAIGELETKFPGLELVIAMGIDGDNLAASLLAGTGRPPSVIDVAERDAGGPIAAAICSSSTRSISTLLISARSRRLSLATAKNAAGLPVPAHQSPARVRRGGPHAMGEFPARFVAQDFVTPPELIRLAADPAEVQAASARPLLSQRIQEDASHGTIRTNQFGLPAVDLGPSEPALVYLLNPTAGLMDGDGHRIDIHAAVGTRAVVTGQSATRIHPCLRGFCTQQWRVTVEDGAILVVLPGPTVLFRCRFFQRIFRRPGGTPRSSQGRSNWFAGRFYARRETSERFDSSRSPREMVIIMTRLVFRDRFAWHGPWDDETARWHFAGFPAAGSLFATGTFADDAFLSGIDRPPCDPSPA